MASTVTRILKNTGWLYAKMGITMFVSLYTTRLILGSLGASDFGIFNVVGGAIGMLGFLNAAMAGSTVRFMAFAEGAGDIEKKKTIFNVSFILHLLIAVIIGLSLVVIGIFLFDGVLNIPEERIFAAKIVFGTLVFSTILTIVNVPYEAIMNSHENMKYYAFIGIIESLLKLTVAFSCVYTSYDKLIVYGVLMASIPLFTLSVMKVYCHKHYDECIIAPRIYYNSSVLKEMTSFAGWNLFATAASMITNSGVGIVFNMFFGTIVNAAQGIANQICGQLMSLTSIMSKAITPVITKSEGAQTREKTIMMAETSGKLLFFVLSLLALPALATMPTLMKLWLKEVPEFAVFFAFIQLLIHMCEQLASGYSVAINATGRIKGICVAKSVLKFTYLPLSYLLFKVHVSIEIVYIILFLIQGLFNGLIVTLVYSSKVLSYSFLRFIRSIFIPVLLVSAITYFTGKICDSLFDGWISIISALITCSLVNSLLFFLLVLNKNERMLTQSTLFGLFNVFLRRC